MNQKLISFNLLYFSLPLSILTLVTAAGGIFIDATYIRETASYAAQGMGQDLVNFLIVAPALVISSILVNRKGAIPLFIWLGTLIYLIYSFLIYCFTVHFNYLFLVYCAVLGLSFFAFFTTMFVLNKSLLEESLNKVKSVRSLIILLQFIAVAFSLIWLKEIIPALILGDTPKSAIEAGLPVNPVHVLDISLLLPGMIISTILIKKKKTLGFILAPSMLIFAVLMALAIGGMMMIMNVGGLQTDMILTVVFGLVAVICLLVFIHFSRQIK